MKPFPTLALSGCTLLLALACGGTSFTGTEDAGGAGGTGGGGSGGKGATGGSGGGGRSSGSSGTSAGGSGGAGGTSGGSAGASGSGGTGGSSGSAGAGTGGAGGDAGSGAGVGGSAAGVAGCGPCLAVACGPPLMVTVTAANQGAITNLEAEADFPVTCYPGGGAPCQWFCQSDGFQLPSGDHSVTLSAPGFDSETIEFTVEQQTNCGCCGCGCPLGYYGSVELGGDGGAECCANLDTDPLNCGSCGHACNGSPCISGKCENAVDCSAIAGEADCQASTSCHSVYVDPGDCFCSGIGCCAQFSFCADGDLADCEGANVACLVAEPYCEEPAYVVSYAGSCYEGCVAPSDCAP